MDHCIVNAADVPSTVFASEDGAMLRRSCTALTVVWSPKDRTLEASSQTLWCRHRDRLGPPWPCAGFGLTGVSVKELVGSLCHPHDVHSGLYSTPWPDASHGMYVDGYARMLRDGRWS